MRILCKEKEMIYILLFGKDTAYGAKEDCFTKNARKSQWIMTENVCSRSFTLSLHFSLTLCSHFVRD